MDYVKKFLNVEGIVGQGAFGRVLITSPLENQASITSQTNLINSNSNDSTISIDDQSSKTSTRFALKCIHPILRPSRLASELRYLRDLGGRFNVVKMYTAHLWKGSLYVVMELIEHDRFVDIVADLEYMEIVIYMKNLLIALEHVHSHNIMHRDIKPANFLFNRKNMKFLLVDFGLAQPVRVNNRITQPQLGSLVSWSDICLSTTGPSVNISRRRRLNLNSRNHNTSSISKIRPSGPTTTNLCKFLTPIVQSRRLVGTRCDCRDRAKTCSICLSRPDSNASKSGTPGFKAPEILLKSFNQTTALDIWSAGVIFACLLAGHTPMFRDVDDSTSLAEIITLLGSQKVVQAAQQLGTRLTVNPRREPVGMVEICKTLRYKSKDKKHYPIPDSAYDLLNQMLDPNPNSRITASAALAHPFFR